MILRFFILYGALSLQAAFACTGTGFNLVPASTPLEAGVNMTYTVTKCVAGADDAAYTGVKSDLRLWYQPTANHEVSSAAPTVGALTLPNSDPGAGAENFSATFAAGVATLVLSTTDTGNYALQLTSTGAATTTNSSANVVVRPKYYDIAVASITNRANLACSNASTFTYMRNPIDTTSETIQFSFQLTARNAANAVTPGFHGTWGRSRFQAPPAVPDAGTNPVTGSLALGAIDKSILPPKFKMPDTNNRLTSNTNVPNATCVTGVCTFTVTFAFNRNAANTPDGPFDALEFGIARPQDRDGAQVQFAENLDTDNDTVMDKIKMGQTLIRFGRLLLRNAYGTELQNLRVPFETQFWTGSTFAINILDNCTRFSANAPTLYNYRRVTSSCDAAPSWTTNVVAVYTANAGKSAVVLNNLANCRRGTVNLCVNLDTTVAGGDTTCNSVTAGNRTYLQGNWDGGTSYNKDPKALAGYGVYTRAPQLKFMRENTR